MSGAPNPFAAPESDVLPPVADGVALGSQNQYRSNNVLIHGHEGAFADRCVKCNAPTGPERLKRVLYWHHPAVYLLIIPGILFYAIAALIARKKAIVHLPLC